MSENKDAVWQVNRDRYILWSYTTDEIMEGMRIIISFVVWKHPNNGPSYKIRTEKWILICWLHHIILAYKVTMPLLSIPIACILYLLNLYHSHLWICVIRQAVLHCWKTTTNFKIWWSAKLFLINLDWVYH